MLGMLKSVRLVGRVLASTNCCDKYCKACLRNIGAEKPSKIFMILHSFTSPSVAIFLYQSRTAIHNHDSAHFNASSIKTAVK